MAKNAPSTTGCLSLVSGRPWVNWVSQSSCHPNLIKTFYGLFIQSASSAWWEETHAPVEDFDVNAKRDGWLTSKCTIQKPQRGTYSRRNAIVTLYSNAMVKLEIFEDFQEVVFITTSLAKQDDFHGFSVQISSRLVLLCHGLRILDLPKHQWLGYTKQCHTKR